MNKQVVDLIRNYVKRLSDDDFSFLHSRLKDRFGGDIGEAVSFIQKNQEMDRWLETAESAIDFYDMIDILYKYLDSEVEDAPSVSRSR